jgi:hypothetical protein
MEGTPRLIIERPSGLYQGDEAKGRCLVVQGLGLETTGLKDHGKL